MGLIPGSAGPLEKENGNPLQYFLPEKLHGPRSLTGCNPWGCKTSDTTEHTHATVPCDCWIVPSAPKAGFQLFLFSFFLQSG